MGIYLFAIRAKAHEIQLPDGTLEKAHEMKFLFNGGSFYNPSPLQKAMQARSEKFWASRELPKYVILMGSKENTPSLHSRVYRWTANHPFWVDCDKFPGEHVGYVYGFRPTTAIALVGDCKHEPRPVTSAPPFDTETGRDICIHCSQLFGPENKERAEAYNKQVQADIDRMKKEDEDARAAAEAKRKADDAAALQAELKRGGFKVEVIADDSGSWMGNALRFDKKSDAEEYAKGLQRRWTAVRQWRVEPA